MEIMNYVIINIATLAFCTLSIFFFKLEKDMMKKVKALGKENSDEQPVDSEDKENEENDVKNIETVLETDKASGANIQEDDSEESYNIIDSVGFGFILLMFVMNVVLANVITYVYSNSVVIDVKLMFVVCMLWPIAFIDYRTKMIPNYILKVMLVLRVLFLVPEFIMLGDIPQRLLSMAVATIAVFLACVLCCLLIKGAIGMGDVKLFSIMALFLGLEGIWSAIFCSLIVSFFISVFSLVTKRVKRKDNIPFAPAILIGTYLSVFLTGI